MALINRGKEIEARYRRVTPMCRALWRVFRLFSYAAAAAAALLGVIAIVLLFVDVSAEELLFTPYMKVVTENGVSKFDVKLGNGIEVLRAYGEVDVSNIKGALYAGIFTLMATLAVCVPVFLFLSKLLKNIGEGQVLSADNAAYVNYMGLSIMIGNPLVLIIERYFNYALIKNFIKGEIRFDFGIDLFGVLVGLLFIAIGSIYGCACAAHREETALVPASTEETGGVSDEKRE